MTKINFPSLFQTSLNKFNHFFIFGNDPTVFERAIFFIQKKVSFPLHIKTEAELLTTSSSPLSLFKEDLGSSLTLVPQITDKIIPHLEQLQEGIFIFTSEKARATSKLVTHFTNTPRCLAIGAYASLITTSEFEFIVGEINLPVSFKDSLFKAYQNDYGGLLCALQKIKLFGECSEAHYESFLESQSSLDDFTPLRDAFLLRDIKKAVELFSLLPPSDLIAFLRGLTRPFLTLFDLLPYKKSPKTIPWQKLTPPVFFKDVPLFESALLRWQGEEIQNFLETLLFLEYKIKYAAFTSPHVSQDLLSKIVSRETI